jgi:hypothetical protein
MSVNALKATGNGNPCGTSSNQPMPVCLNPKMAVIIHMATLAGVCQGLPRFLGVLLDVSKKKRHGNPWQPLPPPLWGAWGCKCLI